MATSRVLAQGRFLPRLISTYRVAPRTLSPIKTTVAARQFTCSSRCMFNASQILNEEAQEQSPSIDVPTNPKAIFIQQVNRRATPADVDQMLKSLKLESKQVRLRFSRFTLHNDTTCAIEFKSEEQAAKALQVLKDYDFMNSKLKVAPLHAAFSWAGRPERPQLSPFFFLSETPVAEALRPLSEGRRIIVAVATPGWGEKDLTVSQRSKLSKEHLVNYLGPYGLQSIGQLAPFFGDRTSKPRMLCQVDFTTKEGAERAIKEINDTDVEGRRVWLTVSTPSPWRAHQIGKFDPKLLADLQSKGIAPEAVYEDKFLTPKEKTSKDKKVKTGTRPAKKVVQEEAATVA